MTTASVIPNLTSPFPLQFVVLLITAIIVCGYLGAIDSLISHVSHFGDLNSLG